jgi:hypothetical protein
MVAEVLRHDPLYGAVLQDPLPLEETPEYAAFRSLPRTPSSSREFRAEFDAELAGACPRLVDWKAKNEEAVASAVREVLGVPRAALSDDDAIRMVLDPSRNRILGETLTLTTHDKLSRALFHASYTFRKKISHTADSQDQRHRMTPASRPALPAYLSGRARLRRTDARRRAAGGRRSLPRDDGRDVAHDRRAARARRSGRVRRVPAAERGRDPVHGVGGPAEPPPQVRDAPLLQRAEEIWRASLDEALQIKDVNPRIGDGSCPRARCATSPRCDRCVPRASASAASSSGRQKPEEYVRAL